MTGPDATPKRTAGRSRKDLILTRAVLGLLLLMGLTVAAILRRMRRRPGRGQPPFWDSAERAATLSGGQERP
jgi:hypothetical protein